MPSIDRIRRECGQSSVELVAAVPLVIAIAAAGFTAVAAQTAAEQAGEAAAAGAIALLQDRPAAAAAREALPERARRRARVRVDGRVISVTVRPRVPIPGLADELAATVRSHAGPRPTDIARAPA